MKLTPGQADTISPEAKLAIEATDISVLRTAEWTEDSIKVSREEEKRLNTPVVRQIADKFARDVKNTSFGGVPVVVVTPKRLKPEYKDTAAVYVHGGGFIMGTAFDCYSSLMADALGMPVYSIEYQLSPEAKYPVAVDETISAYQDISSRLGAHRTVAFGVSAGGNILPAALLKARDKGLALPAATAMFTPWTDLTGAGDTYEGNDGRDILFWENQLDRAAADYVGNADRRDPLVSPAYADFHGFPPTIITAGTRDLFLSNCVRLYWSLRAASVQAELLIWEGMMHGFNVDPVLPEAQKARAEAARFLTTYLTQKE